MLGRDAGPAGRSMALTLGLRLGRESVGGGYAVDTSHAGGPVFATRTPTGGMQSSLPTQALSAGGRRGRHAAILRTRDGRVNVLVIDGRGHGSFDLRLLAVCLFLLLLYLLLKQLNLWLFFSRLCRVLLRLLMARRAATGTSSGLRRGTRRRTCSPAA